MLDDIPEDILGLIIQLLPGDDCVSLGKVSRTLERLVEERAKKSFLDIMAPLSTAIEFAKANILGVRAARVNARDVIWLEPFGGRITTLHLDIDNASPVPALMVPYLSTLSRLTELCLSSVLDNDAGQQHLMWKDVATLLLPRMPHVTTLQLVNTKWRTRLSEEFREPFKRLKSISLDSFDDLSESPDLLSNCIGLRKLRLYDCPTDLPPCIGQLRELRDLEVVRCALEELPNSITQLTCLTRLVLQLGSMTSLPEGFGFRLGAHLIHLDLGLAGRVSTFPWADLGPLTRLTYLNLRGLGISSMPSDAFASNSRLAHLNISLNNISSLPLSLFQLPRLRLLDISGMQLTELPEAIGNLSALTELHATDNPILTLPPTFSGLTCLRAARFAATRMDQLRASDWQGVTKLELLDLSDARIEAFEEGDLSCLACLRNLDLSHNMLQRLPHTISSLTSLTRLDLSMNRLVHVSDGLGELTQLCELHLAQDSYFTGSAGTFPGSLSRLTNVTNLVPLRPDRNGRLRFRVLPFVAPTYHETYW